MKKTHLDLQPRDVPDGEAEDPRHDHLRPERGRPRGLRGQHHARLRVEQHGGDEEHAGVQVVVQGQGPKADK